MDCAGRLGVAVVGAGRVGAVLGAALRGAGHAVVGVTARSRSSRERAELLLPDVPVLSLGEAVRRAELVLLAVPDDALAPLVAGQAAAGGWQTGQLLVHTSGRHGVDVLEPARSRGAIGLAVHPAMTFTGTSLDLSRLPGSAMAVTAPAAVLPIAQALVIELGGEPVVVPEAARPAYHAALAHAANHAVTLVSQARQLLELAGVEAGPALLGPLVRAAVDGALGAGDAALTGPVSRGDTGTIAAHVHEVAGLDAGVDAELGVLPSYRALAAATARRAGHRGELAPDTVAELLAALAAREESSPNAPADPEVA